MKNGYFDNEVPVVIPANFEGRQHYKVVEGNRRVSALKLLCDSKYEHLRDTKVKTLVKKHALELSKLPTIIRVMVVDSIEKAQPHIVRLHTGISKRGWDTDQQAGFYYSLVVSGCSYGEIRRKYPTVKKLPNLLLLASTRDFLKNLKYSDESLKSYVEQDNLKATVINYAFGRHEIASAVGLEFTKEGLLLPDAKTLAKHFPKENKDKLETLLKIIRDRKLSSRSAEFKADSDQMRALISEITRNRQSDVSAGHRVCNGAIQEELPVIFNVPTQSEHYSCVPNRDAPPMKTGHYPKVDTPLSTGSPTLKRGPNAPHTKKYLDVGSVTDMFTSGNVPPNVKELFTELQKIDIQSFPRATLMLIRCLLENIVNIYYKENDVADNKNANPTLSSIIKDVVKHLGGKRYEFAANANKIASGDVGDAGTIKWFNIGVHGIEFPILAKDVVEAWKLVYPFLGSLAGKTVELRKYIAQFWG